MRSLHRWIRSRPLPGWLRDPDEPHRPSRAVLAVVFLGGGATVLVVLFESVPGSLARSALGVAAAVLCAARIITLGGDALRRRRLGPAPVIAIVWLAGLSMLEICLEGWSGGGWPALVLQSVLAGALTVVAWGKIRLVLGGS